MPKYENDFLNTPIEYLKGVGPLKGDMLRKELSITCFGDLIFFFPFRYVDKSKIEKISNLTANEGFVQLKGKINFYEILGEGRAKRLSAFFNDGSGEIELVWFRGYNWIEKIINTGDVFLIFGKASSFNGKLNISHPEIEKVESETPNHLPSFEAVYSSTEKLKAKNLGGKNFSKLVKQCFTQIDKRSIEENLPQPLLEHFKLMSRFDAISQIHFPTSHEEQHLARQRLKFEELFLMQINICKQKLNHKKSQGFVFQKVGNFFNTFYKNHLPFELTDDQKKVIREVRENTANGFQMNRLLQGDVGSGKTIVALLCMLLALDNGFQTCLMAPTEILAQQHAQSIKKMLQQLDINIALFTGSVKGKDRKKILTDLENGEINIVIGTHALIEDTVVFKNLGLAIVDEQHRFGVAQRSKMWKKNVLPPHILVMTATPIPRTLAMTTYGELETSTIKHLPPGRKEIKTVHRTDKYRPLVMDFLKAEILKGRQAYIVYPLIEESEKLDYESLMAGFSDVVQYFPEPKYKVAMVHGKQDLAQREANMQGFIKGEAQILVATTVIEVGVDVPNSSVMLIESAERFGLSQLHQLRGRVGRGAEASFCILMTSNKLSETARDRIHTMVTESSGFAISEKDLELRGPGDIEGTRQSGALDLKIADLVKDVDLMEKTRHAALAILNVDPQLDREENQCLKKYLMLRKDKMLWSKIS